MRYQQIGFLCIVLCFPVFLSCGRSLTSNPNDKSVSDSMPEPASDDEAYAEGLKLFQKSFKPCPGSSSIYAFKDQHFYAVDGFKEYRPLGIRPSDKELRDGILWKGTFFAAAEVTRRFDVLNEEWIESEEGLKKAAIKSPNNQEGIEQFTFPLTKIREKSKEDWQLNTLAEYRAVPCEKVEQLLKRYPR